MREVLSIPVALVGLALVTLHADRLRTILGICGIAIAVLSITLLGGTGLGVIETGSAQIERTGGDLWVTGPTAEFTLRGGGGFENTIVDGHTVAAEMREHDGIAAAAPVGFQHVVSGTDDTGFESFVGVGISAQGVIDVERGPGFSDRDRHYGGGAYDGPLSHEVILDEQTADVLGVDIGDTVYLGGWIGIAEEHPYEVVGISSTFADLLGAPTAIVYLSELQTLTGTESRDPAAVIAIELEADADPEAVRDDLSDTYPQLEVRTSDQQLQEMMRMQSVVIAGGVSLALVAFAAGLALAVNLLAMLVYHQRRELTALKAIGVGSRSIIGLVVTQGVTIGVLGGAVGVLATPPLALVLNWVGMAVVGLDGLVQVDPLVLVLGWGVAVGVGLIASAVAAWRVDRLAVAGVDARV